MWPLSINAENKALKNICSPTNYISVFYSKATWIRQLAESFSPSLADLISKQTLIGRGGKKTPPCKLWWADYGLDPAVIRHPLPCNQLIHGCEQIPGADSATHTVRARACLRLPRQQQSPVPARCSPGKRDTFCTKQSICIPGTYFNCRGSQSTPGSRSLAACRTSSLSTEKLRRCPAWATATRIHSIRGGSTMNGLRGHTEISAKAHEHHNNR